MYIKQQKILKTKYDIEWSEVTYEIMLQWLTQIFIIY